MALLGAVLLFTASPPAGAVEAAPSCALADVSGEASQQDATDPEPRTPAARSAAHRPAPRPLPLHPEGLPSGPVLPRPAPEPCSPGARTQRCAVLRC
ncbi:hypothetical protein B1H18_14390 [Streptomyces tsukubensis]|uniref:Secreted protein n=1 Tax=Streptomyces tsukubensis TaxID=83656 RepID=A0A1V4A8A4_9ACTN|nr:hypothetical protein B1H18_14390 [Streptomyces tsukubensis]